MTSREGSDLGQCGHRGRSRVRVRPVSSAKLATAISAEDHAQGPADAAITLVQYGDYECPYTRLSRHSVPPTFYVNGIRNDGGYDLESLRSAILAHIDGRAQAHSRHA